MEVNNEFPEKVLLGTAQLFRAKLVVTWVNKEASGQRNISGMVQVRFVLFSAR